MNHSTILAGLASAFLLSAPLTAQTVQTPPATDPRVYGIAGATSADRIEADVRTLAGFGTRNTLSDTTSQTRGIGAARRWIKAEIDRISEACGGCMEVFYQGSVEAGERRIPTR